MDGNYALLEFKLAMLLYVNNRLGGFIVLLYARVL
jgi:hypothetical protein